MKKIFEDVSIPSAEKSRKLFLSHKFKFFSLNIALWFRMLSVNLYPIEYSTEHNQCSKNNENVFNHSIIELKKLTKSKQIKSGQKL